MKISWPEVAPHNDQKCDSVGGLAVLWFPFSGEGDWYARHPDQLVPVRHCYDFITILNTLPWDLAPRQRQDSHLSIAASSLNSRKVEFRLVALCPWKCPFNLVLEDRSLCRSLCRNENAALWCIALSILFRFGFFNKLKY